MTLKIMSKLTFTIFVLGHLALALAQLNDDFECPPIGIVYTPHDDCTKYYVCDNGILSVFDCPSTLYYNPELQICDFPFNVPECVGGTRPPGNNTTRPTQATTPPTNSTTPTPPTNSTTTTPRPTNSTTTTRPTNSTTTTPRPTNSTTTTPRPTNSTTTTPRPTNSTTTTRPTNSTTTTRPTNSTTTTRPTNSTTTTPRPTNSTTTTPRPTNSTTTTPRPTNSTTTTLRPTNSTTTTLRPTNSTTTTRPTNSTTTTPRPTNSTTTTPRPTNSTTTTRPTNSTTTTPRPTNSTTTTRPTNSTTPTPPSNSTTPTPPTIGTTPLPNECPSEGIDKIPNPDSCGSYILCVNGVSYEEECAEGLHFNPVLKECDFPENVNCTEPLPVTTPPNPILECPPEGVSFHPYPGNCSLYVICVEGFPIIQMCVSGLCFDPVNLVCRANSTVAFELPIVVETEKTNELSMEEMKNCEEHGSASLLLVPSKRSCEEFSVCHEGLYKGTMKCQSGFHFDFVTQGCIPEDLSTC